jgi:RNA polymerase sigma-70 factor (ECF subfamily)
MTCTGWEETETAVRRACTAGDYDGAATRIIEGYGPGILRFLGGRLRSPADADDVFAMLCEDLWAGLPGFAWRCTARAWIYTLARHAELRFATAPGRRRERNLPLSQAPGLDAARDQVRTTTAPYARTDVKDRFRALRPRLAEEDQIILVLRVDRDLGWSEIAHVLAGPHQPLSDVAVRREEARIRKRFQLIKEKLRRWAIEGGLLAADDRSDADPAG